MSLLGHQNQSGKPVAVNGATKGGDTKSKKGVLTPSFLASFWMCLSIPTLNRNVFVANFLISASVQGKNVLNMVCKSSRLGRFWLNAMSSGVLWFSASSGPATVMVADVIGVNAEDIVVEFTKLSSQTATNVVPRVVTRFWLKRLITAEEIIALEKLCFAPSSKINCACNSLDLCSVNSRITYRSTRGS